MTQLLPSVSGGKAQTLRNVPQPAFKSMLSIVFGLVCLLMLMTGTSEAKGGRGGHSFAQKGASPPHGHRQNSVRQPKHKHKPGQGADADAPDDADSEAEPPEAPDPQGAAEAIEAADVAANVVYGMEITVLYKGAAAKEGLGIGDIILKVNGTPTPTFEALSKALAQAGSRAQVLVIRDDDDDDDEPETITLFPQNGLIGVTVEPVRVD
jgi:membrane-associated protease RseP (regulator of RpoE activity)